MARIRAVEGRAEGSVQRRGVEVLRVQEIQRRRSWSLEVFLLIFALNSEARRRKKKMLFHPDLFNFLTQPLGIQVTTSSKIKKRNFQGTRSMFNF